MKKTITFGLALLVLSAMNVGCSNSKAGEMRENQPSRYMDSTDLITTNLEQVVNCATCVKNGFEMNLFSNKEAYKSTETIQIWATLKYIGNDDIITIWHGDPYMVFSITDGKDFNSGGFVYTILTSTVLEKDETYRFDYKKSGGWSADDPSADFWENFYEEKDLILPVGEYTIAVRGDFSLSEEVVDSRSELLCELNITVE